VLWRRIDLVPAAPDTWADIEAGGLPFGFPQRDSGLFGTFYELILGLGGDLFALEPDVAAAAAETLRSLGARLPRGDWHYDDVDRALGSGAVAMAAAWPGGTGALRAMPMGERLAPSPYPAGPHGRITYAGCHGWAIPNTAGDVAGAVALIERLAGLEGSTLEAASGAIPAHRSAAAAILPVDEVDALRLDLTRQAIATQMATYPPHPNFAAFEDAGWRLVADCLARRIDSSDLAARLAAAQEELLADCQ
jgi:multiple sugar transport system substrate-binding protein